MLALQLPCEKTWFIRYLEMLRPPLAMTECEIMRLEKATMIHVLHEEPAFSEMFVSHLLARTSRVEADLVDQLFNSSEEGVETLGPTAIFRQ